MSHEELEFKGIRQHNLKDLNLTLSHDEMIVLVGPSGSGKSTLAYDTIYAEGGRRYIETFSPYTRQFLDKLERPEVDAATGIRPAIALEQHNRVSNSRSTVGTTTEINEYLKLIWAYCATPYCPECRQAIVIETPETVLSYVENALVPRTTVVVAFTFSVPISGLATTDSLKEIFATEGYLRFLRYDSQIVEMESLSDDDLKRGNLTVVADRVLLKGVKLSADERDRVRSAAAHTFASGRQDLSLHFFKKSKHSLRHIAKRQFSSKPQCNDCGVLVTPPKPSLFSFNNALGACPDCHGFGKVLRPDPGKCIPDASLAISEGAIACWSTGSTTRELRKLKDFCRANDIDLDTPWHKLPEKDKRLVLEGPDKKSSYKGVFGWFEKLKRKSYKMHIRVFLARYRGQFTCETCNGTRLRPDALLYEVAGHTLPDIWNVSITNAHSLLTEIASTYSNDQFRLLVIEEALSRLGYLLEVGLHYLTLDRATRSLSGGESQRVNLTALLGARLVNTTVVLDEPTIGLHHRDTRQLLGSIDKLRDRGNTVILVEHDADVIRHADTIVEIGPEAGSKGGEIVFQGRLPALLKVDTATSRSLNHTSPIREQKKVGKRAPCLKVEGASANNLKDVSVSIPLNHLVAVCGVSGSGKSTLLSECLEKPFADLKKGLSLTPHPIRKIKGADNVSGIVLIDQAPIGKTPRSNPATYTKAWDLIRECLAESPTAEQLGLGKSAFSFNVEGGRCPNCKGAGKLKVEMQFLSDVFIQCEDCLGSRFQDRVLEVRYRGKNVTDFLEMTLEDSAAFFASIGDDQKAGKISTLIKPLVDLGLGYMTLGQPLNTVSGGEAQRIKLASYLSASSKEPKLFILDEPTTGLHHCNIESLLKAFDTLIEHGHSVVVIEHNLDVLRSSDWLIELGPEGGEGGGHLIFEGPPDSKSKNATPTQAAIQSSGRAKATNKDKRVSKASPAKDIEVIGARHHNLKNVSVSIPHNLLTVITGVSGSGKSTLAFDLVFAEGQRRYIDCLSPYARQFISQLERPDVDSLNSIPPTIAVSQKTAPPLGISTVATTTEIYQYLRLLYAKCGTLYCPEHQQPITKTTAETLVGELIESYKGERLFIFAPVVSGRKGVYQDLFQRALKADIEHARIDGEIVGLSEDLRLKKSKLHWVSLLVGSVTASEKAYELLLAAVEQALLLANGTIEIAVGERSGDAEVFSLARVCPVCKKGFRELDPQDFSFRSARGQCTTCSGWGYLDEDGEKKCPDCEGARIKPLGRSVRIGEKRIHEMTSLTPVELKNFLQHCSFPEVLEPVVRPILLELEHRLDILCQVGLDYLHLDRESATISGGEAQRLRLARALGSPLTGVCYVLDEPTIGLHPKDHQLLLTMLHRLRDQGNTVIVVEHDELMIRAADHIIDVGPGGGKQGGQIVAEGSVSKISNSAHSVTGACLSGAHKSSKLGNVSIDKKSFLSLRGASANNLKEVDISFPTKAVTAVCGVSGAGKSSLVHQSLVPAILSAFEGNLKPKKNAKKVWKSIEGIDNIERFFEIDQTPIGRTSTSTPASFLGVFNHIRNLFASLPESQARGWKAGHFSYNSGAGRCRECEGKGAITIPMNFLPDAVSPCESCNGLRYNDSTLEISFHGLSIGALLQKTIDEVRDIFIHHPKIKRTLDYVHELGIGYIALGQRTDTLSGGEAQRIKIAKELGAREAIDTLYILDEPTIGLHMNDVGKLLSVLRKLVDKGNTILLIEHDLDILRQADYLIEVGPGPGESGGEIVFEGTPLQMSKLARSTETSKYLSEAPDEHRKISNA